MSDHIGRSWSEHPLEDACPCPQEACGLVAVSRIDPACHQHALAAGKTIRQSHTAERCPMTAPTSPKPHTPADLTESKDVPATLDNEAADAGLRTALTKLADELTPDERAVAYDIRALLAAHPAPEHVCTPHCDTERGHYPAPVSDTRREDVGAAGPDSASGRGVQVPDYYGDGRLEVHATPGRAYADLTINTYGHWSIDITVDQLVDAIEKAGGPHLAVLPAPPAVDEIPEDAPPYLVGVPEGMEWDGLNHDELVELGFDAGVLWGAWDARRRMPVVDEAEVRERIAQDIEAVPHGHRALYPASHFADIARGATR